jgi:hypothetical protein
MTGNQTWYVAIVAAASNAWLITPSARKLARTLNYMVCKRVVFHENDIHKAITWWFDQWRDSLVLRHFTWGPFSLYSLDKIQLLRIMLSCFSQLEFPVVSGQHTISKYKSLVHMSSGQHTISKYKSLVHMSSVGTFFMWNQVSACSFSLDLKNCMPISQSNLPGLCVLSDGTNRYWTGKCYLSSRFHLKLISRI